MNTRRPAPVKSAFMQMEEIQEERRRSGWNPYAREEENWEEQRYSREEMGEEMMKSRTTLQMEPWEEEQIQNRAARGMAQDRQRGQNLQQPQTLQPFQEEQPMDQMPQIRPWFQQPDYGRMIEEQMEEERSLRTLQSMYPQAAKMLLPYVEEECDKLEYEGSPMFDIYPDPTTLQQIQDRIRNQVQDSFPEGEAEEPEDMVTMQYLKPGRRSPGRDWLGDLIRVLVLDDMHHRRCRYRRCR